MNGLDGLAVSQLTEFLRVKASLKNSGHEPNQPLSVSDELSKHLQPTKPHPYYIYATSFLFFLFEISELYSIISFQTYKKMSSLSSRFLLW